jgi:hypothetical protein
MPSSTTTTSGRPSSSDADCTVQHTTPHDSIPHNTTQHNTTQHNTTQHNTTQHNTTQHNTTQHNTRCGAAYRAMGCETQRLTSNVRATCHWRCWAAVTPKGVVLCGAIEKATSSIQPAQNNTCTNSLQHYRAQKRRQAVHALDLQAVTTMHTRPSSTRRFSIGGRAGIGLMHARTHTATHAHTHAHICPYTCTRTLTLHTQP